ncbi:transposase [Kitasatospora sp. NPDC001540]|uniref:transposase n=1 Tax=Kitasatospora sp. NPDC001540 TaxID=3364014 RepID=UPI0036997058
MVSGKSNMNKRYPADFKRDAVEPALSSGKTVTEVARDLGVSAEELARLRRQVRELEQTVEVLGKATAFFANRRAK